MSTNDPQYGSDHHEGQGGYGVPAYAGHPGAWRDFGADPKQVGTQPGKHVGPVEAIKRFYGKYTQFSGRASRSEYWWVQLFFFLVFLSIVVLGNLGPSNTSSGETGTLLTVATVLWLVFLLGSFLPGLALGIRRLHDANLSGWLVLLNLIPLLGGLVMIVLTILPSSAEGARFDR